MGREGGNKRGEKGEMGNSSDYSNIQVSLANSDYSNIQVSLANLPDPNPALGQDLSGENWSMSAGDEEQSHTPCNHSRCHTRQNG